MGVLLEKGIGCKLAGLAASGTKEIAVDVIANAGGLDVIVQTLIETMMTGGGPRTEWAGLVSTTWPVTSQSNSIRIAARCCFTDGGDNSSCRS